MTSEVIKKETTSTESGSSKAAPQKKPHKHKRIADVLVVIFCVSGALFSLNLFRLDLFQSIASLNKKPAGTVTVKHNNVQRRFSDRMLWSRLSVESPVYFGDLIRVAEYSSATLHINKDNIDINENSLIRVGASVDDEGRIVIYLGSGSLSVSGGKSDVVNGGVALNVMDSVIAPQAGTILSVSAGENGMTVQVNEGSVLIKKEDGQSSVLVTGENLSLDINGVEQAVPYAVVTLPRPNARLLKNSADQLNVLFSWKTANLDKTQSLRLEIAAAPNFYNLTRTLEGIDSANTTLGAGTWYWRLSYQGTVLSSGRFTIVDAMVSAMVSPIQNSQFRYWYNLPSVRFEWQPAEEASFYILQAGLTPDLSDVLIARQTAVASFVEPVLQAGTWYWHVKPVYSSIYEGSTVFSPVASFKIEQIDEPVNTAPTTANLEGQNSSPSTELAAVEKQISPSVTMVLPVSASGQKPEPEKASGGGGAPAVLLPKAKLLQPVADKKFTFDDFRKMRQIDFSWEPVEGANAYIFTLYKADGRRRQITQTKPLKGTNWTLSELKLLDGRTFIWRVEAVNINDKGKIEQRGSVAENTFIIDIPVTRAPEIEDIGVIFDDE